MGKKLIRRHYSIVKLTDILRMNPFMLLISLPTNSFMKHMYSSFTPKLREKSKRQGKRERERERREGGKRREEGRGKELGGEGGRRRRGGKEGEGGGGKRDEERGGKRNRDRGIEGQGRGSGAGTVI